MFQTVDAITSVHPPPYLVDVARSRRIERFLEVHHVCSPLYRVVVPLAGTRPYALPSPILVVAARRVESRREPHGPASESGSACMLEQSICVAGMRYGV